MNPILFIDFDGTLCHDRFWRSLKPELKDRVQEYLFTTNKDTVGQWMKGVFTSEEINKKIADDLAIDYRYLWSTFVRDCEEMNIDAKVLEKINELRMRFTTVLITDNMDCFDRFTVPSLKLHTYFDEIINSSTEKLSKNENNGALFRQIIGNSVSQIDKSILIDNSKTTCEVFSKLGGNTCLVTKEQPLAYWLSTL